MKEQKGFWEEFAEFVKTNMYLVGAGIISGLLSYGYEMVNFALTIDEEANWNKNVANILTSRISDGRFGWGLLSQLSPRAMLPFWSTALFVIFIVFAGILLAYLYKNFLKSAIAKIAVAVLFITMPIHAFYVMFSQQSAQTALGYCLVIGTACLVEDALRNKKNIQKFILPLILFVFSIGIYQSLLLVYVALVCGLIVLRAMEAGKQQLTGLEYRNEWKNIGKHALFTAMSGVVYLFVAKLLQFIFVPSRGYIESFMNWEGESVFSILKQSFIESIQILLSLGNHKAYGTMYVFTFFVAILGIWGLCRVKKQYKILFLIGMAGLVSSNFMMSLFAGDILPERTFLTLPVYTAIIYALAIEVFDKKYLKGILATVLVLLVVRQTAISTDLFWAENRRVLADETRVTELTNEIAKQGHGYVPDIPVAIVTETKYQPYDGTFGFSYFELGDRIYGYLNYYGFSYLKPDKEQKELAYEVAETMPVFPEEGSVIEEQGIIIVNLKTD